MFCPARTNPFHPPFRRMVVMKHPGGYHRRMSSAIQPLSVSELTARIKQTLEQGFPDIRVIGEVSRLKRQPSGHVYFTVKDEGATLPAVIWKSTANRLRELPAEGGQYIFEGRLSVYPPQGRYQLVVTRVEAAGSGALAIEFERRKRIFAERGWFDPARKRPLPEFPKHIGIVTSPTGAAIQDVRKVLATRPGWLSLTLAPTLVQGEAAAPAIARAIARLQALPEPPDVLLVVRGGGSPEDLWCFNDEAVVRAIAECGIPVITGIGHEIDVTLADFAADRSAATPSNAAELCCPDRNTLRQRLPRLPLLRQLMDRMLAGHRQHLARQRMRLVHDWRLARDGWRMDVERHREWLARLTGQHVQQARQQLAREQHRLAAMNPLAVLERGYVICEDERGRVVPRVRGLNTGDALRLRFHDGEADAHVAATRPEPAP